MTSEVDIILKKLNSHNTKISLKNFLDFLVNIARKFDPQYFSVNQKDCFNFFVKNYFDRVISMINSPSGFCDENNATGSLSNMQNNSLLPNYLSVENILKTFEFDFKIKAIIQEIIPTLKEIYKNYFIFEIKNRIDKEGLIEGGFQSLIQFTKEFEINPYLCHLSQIVIIWDFLINMNDFEIKRNNTEESILLIDRDIGHYFKFSKFSALIVYLSIISFSKYVPVASSNSISNHEKLLLFLEKLQNSKGFLEFDKKANKPNTSKLYLVPNKSTDEIKFNPFGEYLEEEITNLHDEKSLGQINFKKIREYNSKCMKNEESELKDLLLVDSQTYNKIQSLSNSLLDIFLFYSKIGDKLNNSRLTLTSFTKFLRDCDLMKDNTNTKTIKGKINITSQNSLKLSPLKTNTIKKLTITNVINNKLNDKDVSVLFHTLTGVKNFDYSEKIRSHFNKNKGVMNYYDNCVSVPKIDRINLLMTSNNIPLKMDFYLFIKSFELLAAKLYPEMSLDSAVNSLLENDLSKLLNDKQIITDKNIFINLLNSLHNEETDEILTEIKPLILSHYINYSDPHKLMSFEFFYEFYKDFGLFPDIINLIKMKNLFSTLSDIFINEIRHNQYDKNNSNFLVYDHLTKKILKSRFINNDLFIDSLLITANSIKINEDYSQLEKVLFLFERMNQSGGIKNSQKRTGMTFSSNKDFANFFLNLKEKYPDFYRRKNNNNKEILVSYNGIFD